MGDAWRSLLGGVRFPRSSGKTLAKFSMPKLLRVCRAAALGYGKLQILEQKRAQRPSAAELHPYRQQSSRSKRAATADTPGVGAA